jgi:hypothetical protein
MIIIKKYLILFIIFISLNLFADNIAEIKPLPDKMPSDISAMSKEQIYSEWKKDRDALIQFRSIIIGYEDKLNFANDLIEKNEKIIKKIWVPHFSFGIDALAGVWNNYNINPGIPLRTDTYILLNLRWYFLSGHAYISGGAGYKVYDSNGGCIEIGGGFVL